MDINYFDLVVGIIILLLGLKGILNGFFKELFGLIGIIGGIFVASRVGNDVGKLVSDAIFKFDNQSAISFTGFLVSLATFWLVMILLGQMFKKLTNLSGLGALDRVFGFILGSGKFFLIASVITFSIFNIKIVKSNLQPMMENSIMLPILVSAGGVIMKLDPAQISNDINNTVDSIAKDINNTIEKKKEEIIDQESQKIIDQVSDKLKNIPQGE